LWTEEKSQNTHKYDVFAIIFTRICGFLLFLEECAFLLKLSCPNSSTISNIIRQRFYKGCIRFVFGIRPTYTKAAFPFQRIENTFSLRRISSIQVMQFAQFAESVAVPVKSA